MHTGPPFSKYLRMVHLGCLGRNAQHELPADRASWNHQRHLLLILQCSVMWVYRAGVFVFEPDAHPPGSRSLLRFSIYLPRTKILSYAQRILQGYLHLSCFLWLYCAFCLCLPYPRVQAELRRSKQALATMEATLQVRNILEQRVETLRLQRNSWGIEIAGNSKGTPCGAEKGGGLFTLEGPQSQGNTRSHGGQAYPS